MELTYQIKAIEGNRVSVEYSDGTWAEIYIDDPNITLEWFESMVRDFAPNGLTELDIDVESILNLVLNEDRKVVENSLSTEQQEYIERQRRDDFDKNVILTYAEMRARSYPFVGDQLDALHKARAGDTTELEAIDIKIEEVKSKYPKDTPEMSAYEFNQLP